MIRTPIVLAFLGLLSVARVSAQDAVEVRRLIAWDDSLQGASSVAAIEALQSAVNGKDASRELRNSMLRLRRAEISNNHRDIERALGSLMRDASQHPQWHIIDFILGRAFVQLQYRDVQPGIWSGQYDGESIVETAWRFFGASLRRDPGFEPARGLVLDLLVRAGERELMPVQLTLLSRELDRPFPSSAALLVWGRHLRAEGKFDSALKVLSRAALTGEDRSRIALERAWAFRGLGDTASARIAYWDGLERITPVGRLSYRYDLAWLITADSLKVFDAVPDDSLVPWMRRFWDQRDAAAANAFGERLQEHLRRWVHVVRNFRVHVPWRKTDFARTDFIFDGMLVCVLADSKFYQDLWDAQPTYPKDLRSRERLLDQRGLIYLRHGEPYRVLGQGHYSGFLMNVVPVLDLMPNYMYNNASWLYWFEGSWRLLHFRGSHALGMEAPTTLASFLPLNEDAYQAIAQSGIAEYATAAASLIVKEYDPYAPACLSTILPAIDRAKDDSHTALVTDSDNPPLLDPWKGVTALYGVGDVADTSAGVVVTFAIPVARLKATREEDEPALWPVHLRIVAYQPSTGNRVVMDTVRKFAVPDSVRPKSHLTGWAEIPLTAGTWQVAVHMKQGNDSAGMFSVRKDLVIPDGARLALSDIVPGNDRPAGWSAPDGQLFAISALGTWRATEPLELYYEVRGVPAGASFATSIQIRTSDDSLRKPLIDVGFTDLASGTFAPTRKSLNLQTLKPGRYHLVVTVTSQGRSVNRRTAFEVIKP